MWLTVMMTKTMFIWKKTSYHQPFHSKQAIRMQMLNEIQNQGMLRSNGQITWNWRSKLQFILHRNWYVIIATHCSNLFLMPRDIMSLNTTYPTATSNAVEGVCTLKAISSIIFSIMRTPTRSSARNVTKCSTIRIVWSCTVLFMSRWIVGNTNAKYVTSRSQVYTLSPITWIINTTTMIRHSNVISATTSS